MHARVREDAHGLHQWVRIYIGKQEIDDLAGLDTRVRDGSELLLELPPQPKVTFVQEHRIVEVAPGKTIKEIALEVGIDPNRKYQRLVSCEGLGIFDGCLCWVKAKEPRAVSKKSWTERSLHDLKGWQRLACQTRVFGDIEVWTMVQGDERLREPRPIAPPPPRPAKRERFLESIFRSPAPDDEEGDAGTKPSTKKNPTDTKAPVPAPVIPPVVPVDEKKIEANLAAPPIPDAQEAKIDEQKAERKIAHPAEIQGEPGPSEPRSGALDAGAKNDQMPPAGDAARPETHRVEAAAQVKGVATPIVSAIPPKGADEPMAVERAEPSEGAKTALAESTDKGATEASPTTPAEETVKKDATSTPPPKGEGAPGAKGETSDS